jgi:hypothetical protein
VSVIVQISPLTRATAARLAVAFPAPTLRDAILVAAFRLPRAALARVVDSRGTLWQHANTTQRGPAGAKLEVWFRDAGRQYLKVTHPYFPGHGVTMPGPAGVTSVVAYICNRQVLPISGLVVECRRHTKIGEGVQAAHDLLLDARVA